MPTSFSPNPFGSIGDASDDDDNIVRRPELQVWAAVMYALGGVTTMSTINSEASPIAIAIAGGAIAIALLDNLIERGVLTTENGRDVLAEAQRRLVAFTNNADVSEADRVISCLFQGMPNHSGYSTL
jgi:hypothetical protein